MVAPPQLPDKLFFKIGEVADLVGVKPHVLRYWESEFTALRPMKTRGAHRVYKRRDVELAMLIRRLLHDEGYTIPGARKRLRELRYDEVEEEPPPETRDAAREVALRAELLALRAQLSALLATLDAAAKPAPEPVKNVTVTAVVPAPVSRGAR
jgi:DNA-binding transcriptional MerR regulator